jgi:hypothetical protein
MTMAPLMTVPPFEPGMMALIAMLNPVVIATAVLMGRQADQWQKVFVAGFAAAFAGAVAVWLATALGILPSRGHGSDAGIFALSFVYGSALAALSYTFLRKKN